MTAPTQIVSSVLTWDLVQVDGTHNVRETHTDDQGNTYVVDYNAPDGYDSATRLANDAADLTASFQGV